MQKLSDNSRVILRHIRNAEIPITLLELLFHYKMKKIFSFGLWENGTIYQTVNILRTNFEEIQNSETEVLSAIVELQQKEFLIVDENSFIILTDKGSSS